MKKIALLLVVAFTGSLVFLSSCKEDPVEPGTPIIGGPSETPEVQIYGEGELEFNVTTEGGYKSATVSALNYDASIVSQPAAGDKSGKVVVKLVTGEVAGKDAVTLQVKDSKDRAIQITQEVNVSNVLSKNITWTNDKIWYLNGRVVINDGVTLTIEPGTIIKGRGGLGTSASVLIVARGGKIDAVGTADQPIIFTSELDNIEVGQKMGTNLDEKDNEKWGGLIILGKAPISAKAGDTESSIEGLPADEAFGKYGGNVADDNSGKLKYVSVRHGGVTIGDGNEINGITFGGVGSGTEIENIEIFATLDDGVEFFGGTVNVKNLMIAWQGDDGVDIDQNYAGTVENFVVTHGEGVFTDKGLEIDGPENSTNKTGKFTLKNGTLINDGIEGEASDFKSLAQGTLNNIVFSGYNGGSVLKIAVSYQNNCADAKADAFTNLINDDLVFTKTKYDAYKVYTGSKADDKSACPVKDADKDAAGGKLSSDATATGADASVFGWTLAKTKGLF